MKSIITLSLCLTLILQGCKSTEKQDAGAEKEVVVRKDATVLFCGDVMLDWGIKDLVEKHGYGYILSGLKTILNAFDFRFCNLECPISESGAPHVGKKYVFMAKPKYLEILKQGSIDGVTLANNHSNDFGGIALVNTLTNLSVNGIEHTGAGVDAEDAHLPMLINIRGISIAVFGYSAIGIDAVFATAKSPGVARASLYRIKSDIKKYRGSNDFIIVTLHWGTEYSNYPTSSQIVMAHAIIDSGADAVIGHHPHIYQGIEIYRDRPILYSLGNFIFGSINEDIRDNIIAGIKFTKKGLHSIKIVPINCNTGNSKNSQYNVLDNEKAGRLFEHIKDISKPLGKNFSAEAFQEDSFLYYFFPLAKIKEEKKEPKDRKKGEGDVAEDELI